MKRAPRGTTTPPKQKHPEMKRRRRGVDDPQTHPDAEEDEGNEEIPWHTREQVNPSWGRPPPSSPVDTHQPFGM